MATKFSRVSTVARRYDTTPSTIWRWANEPRFAHLGFPRPVKIGPNTSVWNDAELDEYDARRMADREEVDDAAAS